jgi:Zn finger protein HypA/HybF involved in hydrogenase expression
MKTTHIAAWMLWIGGTILIVASWIRLVPNEIGWIGFVVAAVGTLLSYAAPSRTHNRNAVVVECDQCRQRLQIPADKGELRVRCPRCGRCWDWKPEATG